MIFYLRKQFGIFIAMYTLFLSQIQMEFHVFRVLLFFEVTYVEFVVVLVILRQLCIQTDALVLSMGVIGKV